MCTPLATATDSLILLVSLCPQDACASVDVLTLYYRIVLLYWIVWLHLPLQSTMSTSCCHSLHLPISLCCYYIIVLLCIIELYWLVFLNCIIALYCVFAYTPQSTVSTGLYLFSSPTCLLVCLYFSCRTDALFAYWHCVLLLVTLYSDVHSCTLNIDIYCCQSACFHNCWGQSPLPSSL